MTVGSIPTLLTNRKRLKMNKVQIMFGNTTLTTCPDRVTKEDQEFYAYVKYVSAKFRNEI